MTKNPNIPDTWGIPDEQASKVQQALSKKSVRPEDALQKTIEDLARDIAIIEPDPMDWAWWVSYLLKQVQGEAEKDYKGKNCEAMLESLFNGISARIDKGKW